MENFRFIQEEIHPLLGDLICPMEIVNVKLQDTYTAYKTYVEDSNSEEITNIVCIKLPNLRRAQTCTDLLQSDHATNVYMNTQKTSVILEIKPKWLHNPMEFCRNCTDNMRKGRSTNYCYSAVVSGKYDTNIPLDESAKRKVPPEMLKDLTQYFKQENNVLKKLLEVQKKLYENRLSSIKSEDDVDMTFQILMTLRDITCFLEWRDTSDPKGRIHVNIVDVDLKQTSKWEHWTKTHKLLSEYPDKISH